MKRMSFVAAGLVALAFLSGCSSTRVVPLRGYDDPHTPGLRYYATKPYLLATSDGVQVVHLPDFSRGYAVQARTLLSRNTTELELENGVTLKTSKAALDATSLFGALGEVFKGAGKEALAALPAGAPPKASGRLEGLYEIVYDEKTGKLVGLRKVGEAK
jgi:hypothetical protein